MPLKCCLVLAVLCLSACNRNAAVVQVSHSSGLGSLTYEDTAAWYVSRDGKTTVLVWIDSHIRGGAKGVGDGDVQGTIHTWPGEKAIDIKAGSKTITLNEKEYDLSKGSIFLVYAKEGPVRVVQLDRDATTIAATEASLRNLAQTDPEIGRFVARSTRATQPATAAASER